MAARGSANGVFNGAHASLAAVDGTEGEKDSLKGLLTVGGAALLLLLCSIAGCCAALCSRLLLLLRLRRVAPVPHGEGPIGGQELNAIHNTPVAKDPVCSSTSSDNGGGAAMAAVAPLRTIVPPTTMSAISRAVSRSSGRAQSSQQASLMADDSAAVGGATLYAEMVAAGREDAPADTEADDAAPPEWLRQAEAALGPSACTRV